MEALDKTFSALAHPVRRAVLARLLQGEASVNDLALTRKVSGPALSRHLAVLEDAGLITRSRDAQRRPCELRAAPLMELNAWINDYRQFWMESSDRLEEHLKRKQGGMKKGVSDAKRV